MSTRPLYASLLAACVTGCGGGAWGCGSDRGASAAADASADAVSPPDASAYPLPDSSYRKPDAGIPSGPPPAGVPEGWLPFDDYRSDCGFWYAPTADKMPPRIQWEACQNPVGAPAGIECRQMTVDWKPYGNGEAIAPGPTVWPDPAGRVIVSFMRLGPAYSLQLIAEADGPVHQAITDTAWGAGGGCTFGVAPFCDAVNAGKYVTSIVDHSGTTGKAVWRGAIGGSVDDPKPRVIAHHTDEVGSSYSYIPAAGGALENGYRLLSWDDGHEIGSVPADPEGGLDQFIGVFSGDAYYFEATSRTIRRIDVWTPQGGLKNFLRSSTGTDEWKRGYVDFNTDGKDMVWTTASGRTDPSQYPPTIELYTAPFTTDPAQVRPRRVTRDPTGSMGMVWKVGCGYAMHLSPPSSTNNGIRIVKLATGESWMLSAPMTQSTDGGPWQGFAWQEPLALTCDDAFIAVLTPHFNIFRVKLSSLGPSIPPS